MRICIEGNLSVGKSQVLDYLKGHYTVYPEPVDEWEPLLQVFYKNKQRYACAMNSQVMLHYAAVPTGSDKQPVVVERSPLSCLEVFSRMHKNEGIITDKEFQLMKDLQAECGWTPDVIIHLTAPAPLCFARTIARGRPSEAPVTEEYLSKLQFYYATMLTWFKGDLHVVDASQHANTVAERVHQIIKTYEDVVTP